MFFFTLLVYNKNIFLSGERKDFFALVEYLLNSSMESLDSDYHPKDNDVVISLLSTQECEEKYHSLPFYPVLSRNIKNHNIQYCKVDLLKDCVLGTLLIPDKHSQKEAILSLSFYMNRNLLILVDDERHLPSILSHFEKEQLLNARSLAEFLCQLIAVFTAEDALFLQTLEQQMGTLEESFQKHTAVGSSFASQPFLYLRKDLLILHAYYQQLLNFYEDLKENSNHFFPEEDCQLFSLSASRIKRLSDHAQMLREYAIQIRELQQSQIDARQNRTMRLLTAGTTIFFPLSLITGWYGMNFSYMPELTAPYGYFILIGLCAVIVAVQIWIFHKNNWFS